MVQVCDRCLEKGNLKNVTIGEKKFDLCSDCAGRISEWIHEGKKSGKGMIGKIFS
mgnify:CR=1 FL=1